MIFPGTAAFLLSVSTPGARAADAAAAEAPVERAERVERLQYAQLIIQQRIIIRVPARPGRSAPTTFREKSAARCQPMDGVGGAAVMEADSVDILYRGGRRIRAELEAACPALDYYSGFYILPTKDGNICAGRDAIRSRAGGECVIKRFRTLLPVAAKPGSGKR